MPTSGRIEFIYDSVRDIEVYGMDTRYATSTHQPWSGELVETHGFGAIQKYQDWRLFGWHQTQIEYGHCYGMSLVKQFYSEKSTNLVLEIFFYFGKLRPGHILGIWFLHGTFFDFPKKKCFSRFGVGVVVCSEINRRFLVYNKISSIFEKKKPVFTRKFDLWILISFCAPSPDCRTTADTSWWAHHWCWSG